jgi:hypothetical protein
MSPPKALAEGRWGMPWLHDYASHGRKRIADLGHDEGRIREGYPLGANDERELLF